MLKPFFAAALLFGCVFPARAADTATDPALIVRDFSANDAARREWAYADGGQPQFVTVDAAHGESLKIPVRFPAAATVFRGSARRPVNFTVYDHFADRGARAVQSVRFSVYIPDDKPGHIRLQAYFFLKNKDGLWFQGLCRRQSDNTPATALESGWNRLQIDLRETAGSLRPQGHNACWSTYLLTQMCTMGVTLTGDQEWNGWAALDDVEAVVADDAGVAAPLALTGLNAPEDAAVYRRWEASFGVNRPVLNPFRTAEIDITANITPPSGEAVTVPAFYAQDFIREKGSDREGEEYRDRFIPQGEGGFRLRFTPRQPGRHNYTITVKYRSPFTGNTEEYTTPGGSFTAAPAPEGQPAPKGYVRVSAKDPHCFEFENGEMFYPVGHNFNSPIDDRHEQSIHPQNFADKPMPKDRGMRSYEDVFPLMAENGVNSFEIWMCSWWLGLEWTGAWKNYNGIGHYNQENAWKLDRLLEAAGEHGLYAHLVIDNHGKASGFCDSEWGLSPYNRRNLRDGGFCRNCNELFTNPKARACYRDLYRYIAARWGWCTNISGIELWSELDLVGANGRFAYSDEVHNWAEEMIPWLKKWDAGRHLVTLHYCSDFNRIDHEMVKRPVIDYIVGDAYHTPGQLLSAMLLQTDNSLRGHAKPFMITEYGGSPHATTMPSLLGDLYCGMWLSWMTTAAGTPHFWWHDMLWLGNYYPIYKAFSRYIAGEDRRRGAGEEALRPDWVYRTSDGRQADFDALVKLEAEDKAEHSARVEEFKRRQTEALVENGKKKSETNTEIKAVRQQLKKLAGKAASPAPAKPEQAAPAPAAESPAPAATAPENTAAELEARLSGLRQQLEKIENDRKEISKKFAQERAQYAPAHRCVARGREFVFHNPGRFPQADKLAASLRVPHAAVLGDGTVFYGFVYDRMEIHQMPLDPALRTQMDNVVFTLTEVPAGTYRIEFWDCREGKATGTAEAAADAQNKELTFTLPPFRTFTAFKIRRQK